MNASQKDLVEKLSSSFGIQDVPPSTLRVLAWLLVSQSAKQTAEDIQHELKMSSGSVSMALNTLHYLGLVERIPVSHSRKLQYRATEDIMMMLAERQAATFRKISAITHEALEQNPDNTRLQTAKASSNRLLDSFHKLLGIRQ